jgi:hypothetical protein
MYSEYIQYIRYSQHSQWGSLRGAWILETLQIYPNPERLKTTRDLSIDTYYI